MRFLKSTFAALLIFFTLVLPQPAHAETEVDAQLVLAVDVSRSMSPRELEIQRRGYAEALVSEDVVKAITSGLIGRVAIIYLEWSGRGQQRIIVDWTLIDSRGAAESFASKLTANFNEALRRTSISGALDFSAAQFVNNGFISNRKIIDVSGDGPNNMGDPVLTARERTLAKGIVINGLPLMTRDGLGSRFHLDNLDEYYRNCVVGGPGSFVVPVRTWDQFPAAVRQKLVLELAGNTHAVPSVPHVIPASSNGYDCLIGEKIWQQFRMRGFWP